MPTLSDVAEATAASTVTLEEHLTIPGQAVGTIAYMSPEQVRAKELDARTDLFSFGAVLYEMVTGMLPFRGESTGVIFKAILDAMPTPAVRLNPELSPKLDEIINKCLEKDRNLRYQHASEIRTDLQRLKRDTESATTVPNTNREAQRGIFGWLWPSVGAIAGTLTVLGILLVGWLHQPKAEQSLDLVQHQLTFNLPENHVMNQAISPDEKYVAYKDYLGLHLRVLASGEEHDLPAPSVYVNQIDWFPDSSTLLLETSEDLHSSTLWTLSILGGNPNKLRTFVGEIATHAVSPDGSQIVFANFQNDLAEIWVMDAHGENPRVLIADKHEDLITPTWSPNGNYIAFLSFNHLGEEGGNVEIWDVRRRLRNQITSDQNLSYKVLCWNRLEKLIYSVWEKGFQSAAQGDAPLGGQRAFSLWKIEVDPENLRAVGKPIQLVKWGGQNVWAEQISSTRDGKVASILKMEPFLNIYIGVLGEQGSRLQNVQQLTLQHNEDTPETWASDSSNILFNSDRNGAVNLFRQSMQHQTATRLFGGSDHNAVGGQFTPDGQWMLYWSFPDVGLNSKAMIQLVRVPVSGGNSDTVLKVPLFLDAQVQCPRRSGKSCVMSELKDNEMTFYTVDPLHGKGEAVARTEISRGYYGWDISPDGSKLAVVDGRQYVTTFELGTSKTKNVEVPKDWQPQSVCWSADGKGVFVTAFTPTKVVVGHVDLEGNAGILLEKKNQWMNHVVASPDGRYLAFKAQSWESNVWLLENF